MLLDPIAITPNILSLAPCILKMEVFISKQQTDCVTYWNSLSEGEGSNEVHCGRTHKVGRCSHPDEKLRFLKNLARVKKSQGNSLSISIGMHIGYWVHLLMCLYINPSLHSPF